MPENKAMAHNRKIALAKADELGHMVLQFAHEATQKSAVAFCHHCRASVTIDGDFRYGKNEGYPDGHCIYGLAFTDKCETVQRRMAAAGLMA